MKKFFSYLMLATFVLPIWGQKSAVQSNDNKEVDIMIGVFVKPDPLITNQSDSKNLLETKLINLCTQNGIGVQPGMSNPIVMGARLNTLETRNIESGVRAQVVCVFELTILTSNMQSGEVFATKTTRFTGIGKTKEEALRRGISSVNTDDEAYSTYVKQGKEKIVDYYNQQCATLFLQANNKSANLNFEEAFNILLSIPPGVSCYQDAQSELTRQYINYIDYKCTTELVQAKAALANNNYDLGFKILSRIYGAPKCNNEVNGLIDKISKEVDEQTRLQWDYLFNAQNNNFKLNQARIDASRDVMVAYYSNRPPVYNYNMILW
jgi:hypothetical protein